MSTEDERRSPTAAGGIDERLQRSRRGLKRLSAKKKPDSLEAYRLYEHLQLLTEKANSLQEELEELESPVSLATIQGQYVKALREIRDDLLQYYWRESCLLQQLAEDDEFAWTVLETVRALRRDWNELKSDIDVYFEDRQGPVPSPSDQRLVSGKAFRAAFLAFVEALSSIGNSPALASRINQRRASGRRHGVQAPEASPRHATPGNAEHEYRKSPRRLPITCGDV